MGELSSTERAAVESIDAAPMLDRVLAWSAINSGSRNLEGLERMAGALADAFSALPGELRFEPAAPVESVDAAGRTFAIEHGRHLHLTRAATGAGAAAVHGPHGHGVRRRSCIPGDALAGGGSPQRSRRRRHEGRHRGHARGAAAVEARAGADRLGYDVVINSDEEVGSLVLGGPAGAGGAGQARGADL